ncbi:hypothetical protein [Nonomuraea sp. NPDC002799]
MSRPWWDDLPIGQKIVVFAAPPVLVIGGLVRLVAVRPSGLDLVGNLAIALLGIWLSISVTRDVLRKRKPRATDGQPLFEVTMRGYRRSDVDQYLASIRQPGPSSSPSFALVFRGYNPRQVNEYLGSIKGDRPES